MTGRSNPPTRHTGTTSRTHDSSRPVSLPLTVVLAIGLWFLIFDLRVQRSELREKLPRHGAAKGASLLRGMPGRGGEGHGAMNASLPTPPFLLLAHPRHPIRRLLLHPPTTYGPHGALGYRTPGEFGTLRDTAKTWMRSLRRYYNRQPHSQQRLVQKAGSVQAKCISMLH